MAGARPTRAVPLSCRAAADTEGTGAGLLQIGSTLAVGQVDGLSEDGFDAFVGFSIVHGTVADPSALGDRHYD